MSETDSNIDEKHELAIQKRNRVWLIALFVVIILIMLSSYVLFNNYWDPNVSDTTFSH